MKENNRVIYREVQKPRQVWIWILIFLIASFSWYSLIQQIFLGNPIGTKPAPDGMLVIFWLIFGVLFPVGLIGFVNLAIEVREKGVYIRFQPFYYNYREILITDIVDYEPIVYHPREFGGRGLRLNLKGEKAYSMNGKDALKLKLKDETVVFTTVNQQEMLCALQEIIEKRDEW